MARKLIDQLFSHSEPTPSDRVLVSLQSWKALVSRLNRQEVQLKTCQKNIEKLNKLIKQWLTEDKSRIIHRERALLPHSHSHDHPHQTSITQIPTEPLLEDSDFLENESHA